MVGEDDTAPPWPAAKSMIAGSRVTTLVQHCTVLPAVLCYALLETHLLMQQANHTVCCLAGRHSGPYVSAACFHQHVQLEKSCQQ